MKALHTALWLAVAATIGYVGWSWLGARDASLIASEAREEAYEADMELQRLKRVLRSLAVADSIADAERADSTAVWRARAASADATIASAREEGRAVARRLRTSLTALQTAQADSLDAMHEAEKAALRQQRDDARAEAASLRIGLQSRDHRLMIAEQAIVNAEIEADRWEAVAKAEAQLARDAERGRAFWRGVAGLEAIGIVVVAVVR